jgi:hypothetical protein
VKSKGFGRKRLWPNFNVLSRNSSISAKERNCLCESKSYKLWFDEECLKLVDRRKQAKLQWLQDPSVVNEVKSGTREGNI